MKEISFKKNLPILIVSACVLILAVLWITLPMAAQLTFSLRIYCAGISASENAVDSLSDDGSRLVFAQKESLQFLSKMALEGELEDVTGCQLSPWPLPFYYIGDWEIGGNQSLTYRHFGKLYIISPKDYAAQQHFLALIDSTMTNSLSESSQIKPNTADRIEIFHETRDHAKDTTVTITDEKVISELLSMYNALQVQETSRPMAEDRFVLTFYQKDEALLTWHIAIWDDDGTIISASSLTQGNYAVENKFDYDRLEEIASSDEQPGGKTVPPELEKTDWQAVSTDAETFSLSGSFNNPNFEYVFEHTDTVPLDQLITFLLVADGASEGASDELRSRFLEAPNIVLTYLELMGGQITELPGWEPMPTAEIICQFIAAADAAWYNGSEEFAQTMADCRRNYPDGRISELLDVLEREHAASMERNHSSGQLAG